MMIESKEKGTSKLNANERSTFFTKPCGAVDERECSMMKHLVLAEMRKSNAPAWVAEELDKMLNCTACRSSVQKRIAAQSDAKQRSVS